MKKIIIVLAITSILVAQWGAVNPKPPVLMNPLKIEFTYWNTPVLDSNQVVIPDSFMVSYNVTYRVFLYDEDNKLVRADITQGDLIPLLTTDEQAWLVDFMNKYGALAKGLVP